LKEKPHSFTGGNSGIGPEGRDVSRIDDRSYITATAELFVDGGVGQS
jgi:hypothetical protein